MRGWAVCWQPMRGRVERERSRRPERGGNSVAHSQAHLPAPCTLPPLPSPLFDPHVPWEGRDSRSSVYGPAELREGCALGGERPVLFFSAANIPQGEEPALVPGPLPAQEAGGGERKREEANSVGSTAGGLVSPPVPIPTYVRFSKFLNPLSRNALVSSLLKWM